MSPDIIEVQPSVLIDSAATCDTSRHNDKPRPLISFCLFAYNQEKFIREAVEGALAQTYSPLEIILSDDCSTDNTFDVMEQLANKYEGPHKIILNRNEKNLGLVSHINKVCCEIMHGDLIVVAAGDDVSFPERTEKSWLAWEASDRKAKMISGGRLLIDSEGMETGELIPSVPGYCNEDISRFILNPNGQCTGAAAMYHRDVFAMFGPLTFAQVEDSPLTIRSRILGSVIALPDKLIKYRVAASSMSRAFGQDYKKSMIQSNTWRIATYDQLINDLNRNGIRQLFPKNEYNALIKICHKHRKKHEMTRRLAHKMFVIRLAVWLRLLFIVPIVNSIDNLVYLAPLSFYPRLMKAGLPTDSRLWSRLCSGKRSFNHFCKTCFKCFSLPSVL